MNRLVFLFILFLFSFQCLFAQQDFNVTIVYDRQENDTFLLQYSFKKEIEALLIPEYNVVITERFSNSDFVECSKNIEEIYNENSADVLIGAGLITSRILSERKDFPLPTIAAINIDNLFSEESDTSRLSTSIHNFTYIQSPFDIKEDLETLCQIGSLKKIAILINPTFERFGFDSESYLNSFKDVDFELIVIDSNPQNTLNSIGKDIDAVYVLSPLAQYTPTQAKVLFQGIAEKKIPSLSLIDYPMLDYGAYAAFSSKENIQKLPRKVAINVSKIAEGKNEFSYF